MIVSVIHELLFIRKVYSLYINKAVDEKSHQAEACCVWRQNYCRQHFCPPILLQMSTGSTTPTQGQHGGQLFMFVSA